LDSSHFGAEAGSNVVARKYQNPYSIAQGELATFELGKSQDPDGEDLLYQACQPG
jgi:hypothetical protein